MKSTARSKLLRQAQQKLLKQTKSPMNYKAPTTRSPQQHQSSARKTVLHSFMQYKHSQLQQSLYLQLFDAFQKRERIRQNLEQLKKHTDQQRITSSSKSVLQKIKRSIKLFNEEIKNQDKEKDICIYPEFIQRYFRWIIEEYEKVKFNEAAFQQQEYAAIVQEYERIIQNNSITHPERVIRQMNACDNNQEDDDKKIKDKELLQNYQGIKGKILEKFKKSSKEVNELIIITPEDENQIKQQINSLEEKLKEQFEISEEIKRTINEINNEILNGVNQQQIISKLKEMNNQLQEQLFEINSQNQAIKNQLNLCKQIQLSYQVNLNKENNNSFQNQTNNNNNNDNNIAPPLESYLNNFIICFIVKVQEYVEENEKKVKHNLEQQEILKQIQTSENEEFISDNLEENFEILNNIVISIQKVWRGYACRKQLTDKLQQNALILETIATLIQKVWRGYRTRKLLREYLEMLILDQENQGEQKTRIPDEQIDNNNNNNQNQNLVERVEAEESEIEFNKDDDENSEKQFQGESIEENFEILNNIVIMIQKVWRGYSCRKLLQQYLEELLENQEQNQDEYQEQKETEDNDSNLTDQQQEQLYQDQNDEDQQAFQENQFQQEEQQQENYNYEKLQENQNKYQQNYDENNVINKPDIFLMDHEQVVSEDISFTEIQQIEQQQQINSHQIQQINKQQEQFKFKDKIEEENEKLLKAISQNNSKAQTNSNNQDKFEESVSLNPQDLPAVYYFFTPYKKQEILQLSQLRAAIGSEQLLRQFQQQQMSSSWSFPLKKLCLLSQLKAQKSLDQEQQQLQQQIEQFKQTLFDKKPFDQFTSGLVNSYIQNAKLFTTFNQECQRAFQSQILVKQNNNDQVMPVLTMSVNEQQFQRYSLEKWVEPKTPIKKAKILEDKKKQNKKEQLTVSLTEAYLKPTLRDMDLSCKISQIKQMTQSSEEKYPSPEQSPFILNQKFFQQSVEINNNNNNIKIIDKLQFDEEQQQPLQVNTEESINLMTVSDLDNQNIKIQDQQIEKQKLQERKERKGIFLTKEIFSELLTEFCQDIYQNQFYKCLRQKINIHDILKSNRNHFQLLSNELIQNYLELLGQQIISTNYIDNFYESINLGYDYDMKQKLTLLLSQKFEQQKQATGKLIICPPVILDSQFFDNVQKYINDINSPMLQITEMNQQLLFSCVNEFLEYFRPFDLRGCPLVWKVNLKKLTYSSINSQNIEIVLNQVFNKLLQASFTQMGVLEENYDEDIYEQEISSFRKQKMEEQIQSEMEEEEEKWTTYDDEESIVGLEIADLVFNQLIQELASEILVKNEEKKNYQCFDKKLIKLIQQEES